MSSKKFFNKQKEQVQPIRGQEVSDIAQFTGSAESEKYLQEFVLDKFRFIPEVDFSDPFKFC